MTKQETIQLSNKHLEGNVLDNHNAHFANINKAKPVWWFDVRLEKFNNDLYLILNKQNNFILLKIPKNTFENLGKVFKIKQEQWVDLEISSSEQDRYMIDIKSGGTKYNFNQHIICELYPKKPNK